MKLQAGLFIKSTEDLNGTVFEDTLIFLTEVNNQGALGFILNKPFHRNLNELSEFAASPSFPLFRGGPVDNEHLYFIHQQPQLIPNGVLVANNIFLGGDFKIAVELINNKKLTSTDIKIFIGYCGWDAGELEVEIEEGSWTLVSAEASSNLFS